MISSRANQIGIGKPKGRVAVQIALWWEEAAVKKESDKPQTCRKGSSSLCTSCSLAQAVDGSESFCCLECCAGKSPSAQRLSQGTEDAVFL